PSDSTCTGASRGVLEMMPALAESRLSSSAAPPPPPTTIEETGLHPDSLAQLLLKTLVAGEASGSGLAEKLRVPFSVLDALIQHARIEKLVEVRGTSGAGTAGYPYTLTPPGRGGAVECMSHNPS